MTNKLFTALILFSAASFFACPPPPEGEDDPYNPDIVYSGRFITVYLDLEDTSDNDSINDSISIGLGNVNRKSSARAMTPDTSRPRLEYFEVCFYFDDHIARSSWEIGKRASVDNVHRTSAGIDYSLTYADKSPNAASGGAILFGGWKEDKTLFAVGKLVKVDDEETTLIKSDSVHVTFEVYMLTAAASHDTSTSSFFADDMNIINSLIRGRSFPLYILQSGKNNISAHYEFKLAGEYLANQKKYRYIDWEDFSKGIIVASNGVAEKREARYSAGNNKYWYADYAIDMTTKVQMTNNKTGSEAQNPVEFLIDTSATKNPVRSENGLFTLAFYIPVYALVPYNELQGEMWHIRPGYKSYYFNIDNGKDSTGGAVLIGVDLQETELEIDARWG